MKILTVIAAAAVLLSGCAGRPPTPIAVVQPQDHYEDCLALTAEINANNQRISELGSEQGAKVGQNVAAGVAGLFIWPLWFAMDFQGASSAEIAALQTRQQYLATLATQRCGNALTQINPNFYGGYSVFAPGQPLAQINPR
jgi:hypothetical protein